MIILPLNHCTLIAIVIIVVVSDHKGMIDMTEQGIMHI